DFAGGTVVHVAAGFAGLAAVLALRPRLGYPRRANYPNSMVLTLTGAGLLWFGWFGLNGGNAFAAGPLAGHALAATQAAAAAAAVYAFTVTLLLVKVIDRTVGFCLKPRAEADGLDRSVHGEVGFDLNPVEEAPVVLEYAEPRPASEPPEGKRRFTVVVQGPSEADLLRAWSALCQAGHRPPSEDFKAVYPYLTTVTGNRFRFRGG